MAQVRGLTGVDATFVEAHTRGFEDYRQFLLAQDLKELCAAAGLGEEHLYQLAHLIAGAGAFLSFYCMGLNQSTVGVDHVDQDVDKDHTLVRFPDRRGEAKPGEKQYTLSAYDAVIAFDPDWTQVPVEQLQLLQKWVDTQAGGLVVVGGPINTVELIRGVNYEKLKPLIDLYPVILADIRRMGLEIERTTTEPWQLNFPGAAGDTDFLFQALAVQFRRVEER